MKNIPEAFNVWNKGFNILEKKLKISFAPETETSMVFFLLRSFWVKNLSWRNSSREWTKTTMERCLNRFKQTQSTSINFLTNLFLQEFKSMCTNLTQEQVIWKLESVFINFCSLQVEAAFTKYDITGDEMLNYKEFCRMIHQNEDNH